MLTRIKIIDAQKIKILVYNSSAKEERLTNLCKLTVKKVEK